MLVKSSTGLHVEVTEVVAESNEEIYATEAIYLVDGESVSDKEMEFINSAYAEEIYEQGYQQLVMSAEYAFEGDR